MSDILDEITAYKRREIALAKAKMPLSQLEGLAHAAPGVRGFKDRITAKLEAGQFALIAEIKKASPSKGLIRADFDPPALARAFASGGAACLSVLTDAPSFQGAPEFLMQARATTALPVLRKDFMLEPYQVVEARAWGADCILIILAAVAAEAVAALATCAGTFGMDVIAEVHDEAELERALALPGAMIGINNRDLKTFDTDLATAERLAARIPGERITIAESGIASYADLRRLANAGIRAFLVGESLMRERDVAQATRRLLGLGAAEGCHELGQVEVEEASAGAGTPPGADRTSKGPRS
jgi:indole-3-glycerol phosphate synthase